MPKNTDFVNVRVLDNFYQTSSFYPMPVVMVSTLAETGQTNLGSYSLVFPYVIAGEHAMMLICRVDSNTSQNIQRTGLAALNFISYDKRLLKNAVQLGYPGETTAEKMERSIYTLIPSQRQKKDAGIAYPEIVREAFQVFECTWDDSYTFRPNEQEAHYLLRIDDILMKERWHLALLSGKGFPTMPIDYGYRNNTDFWFAEHKKPFNVPIPKDRGVPVDAVQYAADRLDPDIKWEREACAKIVNVPRVFLKTVMTQINEEAKRRGVKLITPGLLNEIRDKRSREKKGR